MNGRLILVDDEQELVRTTLRRLERLFPALTVAGFGDAGSALADIRREPPDVLVTDLRMPGMSGLELLLAARSIVPQLPVVLVTAFGTPELGAELRRSPGIEFLEKPFAIDALVAAIERTLVAKHGWSGAVAQAEIADLVQMYVLGQTSGRLEIRQGADCGELWFDQGRIVHARCGEIQGEEAFYRMVAWKAGQFSLGRGDGPAPEANIEVGWQRLLLEGARRMDDAQHAGAWAELGEDAETDLKDLDFGQAGLVDLREERSDGMASINEGLRNLAELDGFIGVCLVDSNSGMMLGSEGGAALNLEAAAAGNTEVVRAKRKTIATLGLKDNIEDILITLGKQYHLIRPLASKDGLFIYLVLDKSRSNLALARHRLADTEKDLLV
jgi:FixJ family two-component response regulator